MSLSIQELLKQIPLPSDYFKGHQPQKFYIPENILCFCHEHIFPSNGEESTKHRRFVFIQNMGERGIIVLDENMLEFDKGQSILFFPFQSHHYLDVKNAKGWLFITFDMHKHDHLLDLQNRVILRTARMDTVLREFLTDYLSDSQEPGRSNRIALWTNILLEESLTSLKSGRSPSNLVQIRESRFEVLEKLQRAIFQSLDTPISISELAGKVHVSESHLRLLFRKEFGMSLGAYIRSAKMMRASRLLATTSMRITEIAYQCGYDTVYAFSRAFKNFFGVFPLKYRHSFHTHEDQFLQ